MKYVTKHNDKYDIETEMNMFDLTGMENPFVVPEPPTPLRIIQERQKQLDELRNQQIDTFTMETEFPIIQPGSCIVCLGRFSLEMSQLLIGKYLNGFPVVFHNQTTTSVEEITGFKTDKFSLDNPNYLRILKQINLSKLILTIDYEILDTNTVSLTETIQQIPPEVTKVIVVNEYLNDQHWEQLFDLADMVVTQTRLNNEHFFITPVLSSLTQMYRLFQSHHEKLVINVPSKGYYLLGKEGYRQVRPEVVERCEENGQPLLQIENTSPIHQERIIVATDKPTHVEEVAPLIQKLIIDFCNQEQNQESNGRVHLYNSFASDYLEELGFTTVDDDFVKRLLKKMKVDDYLVWIGSITSERYAHLYPTHAKILRIDLIPQSINPNLDGMTIDARTFLKKSYLVGHPQISVTENQSDQAWYMGIKGYIIGICQPEPATVALEYRLLIDRHMDQQETTPTFTETESHEINHHMELIRRLTGVQNRIQEKLQFHMAKMNELIGSKLDSEKNNDNKSTDSVDSIMENLYRQEKDLPNNYLNFDI